MRKMLGMLVIGLAASLGLATGAQAGEIWVHDSSGRLGRVDTTTSTVTPVGSMGVQMTDIAFDPSGNLWGISFSRLYQINKATAAVSFVGNHGVSGGNALVFDSDGTLYAAGNSTTRLFSLNTTTGAGTILGDIGSRSAGDLAFNGGDLYLSSTTDRLVRIGLGPVSGTIVGAFGVANVFGLATGDGGTLYGVSGTNVYTVNTSTGAATFDFSFSGQGLGTTFGSSFENEAVAVPLPPAAPLGLGLLLGLGVLGARRRRKQ